MKEYAAKSGVLLMGDMPFLVSRDSADVWAHQEYFRLDLSSGAPPDLYFAQGQRWGMPPYDWKNIEADGFRYLTQNLSQAYDLALETKNTKFPQLLTFCSPRRKLGADNADCIYMQAWIDGESVYRLSDK